MEIHEVVSAIMLADSSLSLYDAEQQVSDMNVRLMLARRCGLGYGEQVSVLMDNLGLPARYLEAFR